MATFIGTNGNDNLTGQHGFQIRLRPGGQRHPHLGLQLHSFRTLWGRRQRYAEPDLSRVPVDGGIGNDIISGSLGVDDLYGGSGDDQINSGLPSGGLDFVDGGDGNDTILAGGVVFGGAGNDTITASSADDDLFGGDGDDVIDAGSGSDDLFGGDGDDLLKADGADGDRPDVRR